MRHLNILPKCLRSIPQQLLAVAERFRTNMSTIGRQTLIFHRRYLKVASRVQILICLTEKSVIVSYKAAHLTTVNEVEGCRVLPSFLKIIDFEPAVRRDPGEILEYCEKGLERHE